jgi:hypothetical protein
MPLGGQRFCKAWLGKTRFAMSCDVELSRSQLLRPEFNRAYRQRFDRSDYRPNKD